MYNFSFGWKSKAISWCYFYESRTIPVIYYPGHLPGGTTY